MTRHAGSGFASAPIGPLHRFFDPGHWGRRLEEVVGTVSIGDLSTPFPVLRQSRLAANIQNMQSFCDGIGAHLAPHAKTSMAPYIVAQQLDAGAWGITVSSVQQCAVLAERLTLRNVLIANEVLSSAGLSWLFAQMLRHDDFCPIILVDSDNGVERASRAAMDSELDRPLGVLVEVGLRGGRGGVRDVREAGRIAAGIQDAAGIELRGVSGFEGIVGSGFGKDRERLVNEYLRSVRLCAEELVGESRDPIVTAGGSAFYPLVAETFNSAWRRSLGASLILRSGCYVAHDHGAYDRYRSLLMHEHETAHLRGAIEIWGTVLSHPEPGLAILDFGRRDTSMDFPILHPVRRLVDGEAIIYERADGVGSVVKLNDQHAYASVECDWSVVGEIVGFGISHPCTTLDKWRFVPVLDDADVVIGVIDILL